MEPPISEPSVDPNDGKKASPPQLARFRFQKGCHHASPGNKMSMMLRDLARDNTRDAFDVIIAIMIDKDAPHASRLKAAEMVLDRGYGRPAQELIVNEKPREDIDLSKLSNSQFENLSNILKSAANTPQDVELENVDDNPSPV